MYLNVFSRAHRSLHSRWNIYLAYMGWWVNTKWYLCLEMGVAAKVLLFEWFNEYIYTILFQTWSGHCMKMMAAGSSSLADLTSRMQTLNCVKSAKELLPSSFSLHSIDLLDLHPFIEHPKMISVTLRTMRNDRAFMHRR